MSVAVRISEPLAKKAKIRSRALQRSLAGQIEYWAKMGQILEDNPDLSFTFVKDILIGLEQTKAKDLSTYNLDED